MVSSVVGVGVRYAHFTLEPVSFELPVGCTALLGTNGAGKTTLLRSMLGLEPRATGHLALGALRSDVRADRREFLAAVGWIPQRPEFPRFVTARQCLAYAADLKGLRGRDAALAVDRAADRTDITRLLGRAASRLSGGQQQRLAIAQAVVHQPALLVMDEPTAGLDPVQRLDFREWLTDYAHDHQVLISTHLIEDIEDVSSQAVVLHEGSLAFTGPTRELLARVSSGEESLDRATAVFLRGLAT